MNFSTKIFLTLLSLTIITCTLISISIYQIFKNEIESEFSNQYEIYGKILGNIFHQLETTTDIVNNNAALLLAEIVSHKKIPSDQELNSLAKILGINAFYVINKEGNFIRSSDLPISKQIYSLYSYSSEYKKLVHGTLERAATPIIPSYPFDIPAKLTMVPSHDKTLILEAGTHLSYISKILHQIMTNDKNIQSIGLYAPNGYELGSISSNGKFFQGRRNINNAPLIEKQIINKSYVFSIKVPTTTDRCMECIQKQVSRNGNYYYILKLEVSLVPLINQLHILKLQTTSILIITLIFSAFISKILSRKLVNKIGRISKTAREIIESGNLDHQVDIQNNINDEISTLAQTFNKMIQALKTSQVKLVESEKMQTIVKIAGQLAHDIRSPLAVMEMTLTSMSKNIPDAQRILLKEAIQSVRDIANNLLNRYRMQDENHHPILSMLDDGNLARPVLLTSLIEIIISHKRQEWINNPCSLHFQTEQDAKLQWITAAPNDIKRILSNLLNNSYQALEQHREINIILSKSGTHLQLQIQDTGCGIPNEKINDVLNGLSLKHPGKGLGLSSAKSYMQKLGGDITLHSVLHQNTIVKLNFPIITKPSWFPRHIIIPHQSPIVILDDDASIHNYWRHRIQTLGAKSLHFMTSHDLLEWYANNISFRETAIFLIDQELLHDEYTGISLYEKLNVKSRGYLITSHADELLIQQCCEQLSIWLVHKSFLGEIDFLPELEIKLPEETKH